MPRNTEQMFKAIELNHCVDCDCMEAYLGGHCEGHYEEKQNGVTVLCDMARDAWPLATRRMKQEGKIK
jgi:hypothetical protein